MKFAIHWPKRIWSDERGNALLLVAATLPLLIGSAAAGVDLIQLSLAKRQMQRTADSGALAGAYALAQKYSVATAVSRDIDLNSRVPLAQAPVVQNAPLSGPYAGDQKAVRVALRAQRSMPFLSFFTQTPTTIAVEATAQIVHKGKYCIIALEEGDVTGIEFTGNADVNLGCGAVSNSSSSQAVVASGSARVNASPVAAVGGVTDSSAYSDGTEIIPHVSKQPDPYADLPVPAPATCAPKVSVKPGESLDLTPGCYAGMDIKGTLKLAPGTYYVAGGKFSLGSQAHLIGVDVTIVLTSTTPGNPASFAGIDINGGAVVELSAPTSGTYAGVLFYKDPRAPRGASTVNGNSSSKMEGAFYFPNDSFTFNGNTGMKSTCIQLVASRLTFSGNSSLTNDCPAGGNKGFDAIFVRLVA